MFHEFEIVAWSCLADPTIFRAISGDQLGEGLRDPYRHLIESAYCTMKGLVDHGVAADQKTRQEIDTFIAILLNQSTQN